MEQIALPLFDDRSPARPHPRRTEPAIWLARLLILRDLRISSETVIQDIRLRRGLNILWAPPTPAQGDAPAGRLTGHSAGKTTFCRMIRYLLGEERFGTMRTQERIRDRLDSGWVVGEVLVKGERWVVARPFARGVHPFALRAARAEDALAAHGGYQDFLAALTDAVVAEVPVKMLPHARQPISWELVLAWLARDQEARFADLLDWRAPASESESPNPSAGDRRALVRALLDLMSDEESELQQRSEALKQKRDDLEDKAPLLRARAAEDVRRLAKMRGTTEEQIDVGPLFAEQWLHDRRAAIEGAEQALTSKALQVEQAQQVWARASEEVGARGARLAEAEDRLARQRRAAEPTEAQEAGAARASLPALRSAAPGLCNVPLALAAERGCPIAMGAPRGAEERQDHEAEAAISPQRVASMEHEITTARERLEEARATQQGRHTTYLRLHNALQEERGRLYRERAALEEIERLQRYAVAALAEVEENEKTILRLTEDTRRLTERRTARRREHADARERFEQRFGDVVRAMLGAPFAGRVELAGGQLELQVTDRGERSGAAMETIKILAFDLAALALGIDGYGYFPGFLVHDGPREADMSEGIYEQLFRHAVSLEVSPGTPAEPAFQYIVTTTGAPPKSLQRAPWLLEPLLDSSKSEGRLLKEDL